MKIGYARVSSAAQKEDRQIDELLKYGVQERNIYVDKQRNKINIANFIVDPPWK